MLVQRLSDGERGVVVGVPENNLAILHVAPDLRPHMTEAWEANDCQAVRNQSPNPLCPPFDLW